MLNILYYIAAAVALGAAAYRGRHLRTDRSPMLRAFCCALVSLGLAFALLAGWSRPVVDHLVGVQDLARWAGNSLALASACSLLVLLSHFTQRLGAPRPRTWIRAAVLLVAVAAMGILMLSRHPADVRDFASRYASDPVILAYLLIYLGYLGVAGTGGMRMSWRYAPRTSDRYLRLGLRLMASGSFTGLLYVGYNAAVELGRWFGLPALSSEGVDGPLLGVLATIQIVAGTTIGTWGPALEARLRQLSQLRAYRQLQPLWAALYDAVPEIALLPGPGSRPGIGFRLYRRVIEIRDGELALRAFRDPAIIAAAAKAAREAGLYGDTLATTVEAAILAMAIRARKSGQAARYNILGAGPLPEPGAAGPGSGLDSEIAWLVKVSRAFTRSPFVRQFAQQPHRPLEDQT